MSVLRYGLPFFQQLICKDAAFQGAELIFGREMIRFLILVGSEYQSLQVCFLVLLLA